MSNRMVGDGLEGLDLDEESDAGDKWPGGKPSTDKPSLCMARPTAESLIALYKKLTGKDPTEDEIAAMRKRLSGEGEGEADAAPPDLVAAFNEVREDIAALAEAVSRPRPAVVKKMRVVRDKAGLVQETVTEEVEGTGE